MGWSTFSSFLSGFLIVAGISGTAYGEWPAPVDYVADVRYDGYEVLTPRVLDELQKSDRLFITFAGGPGCSVSNYVASELRDYQRARIPNIPIYIVDERSAVSVQKITKPTGAVPLILVFKGTRLLDGQLGLGGKSTRGFFDAMMMRQGFPESGIGTDTNGSGNFYLRVKWAQTDVASGFFRNSNLSEVDARELDLTGISFTNSVITHSNFLGANLHDAKLDDTVWISTICPDGSNSDEHGYTCVGF